MKTRPSDTKQPKHPGRPSRSPAMDRRLVVLIAAVVVAGLAVLVLGATRHTSDDLGILITLVILGALAERYAIGLFDSHVSVGVATVLVAAVLAGPWGVALVAPPIIIAGQLGGEAAWYQRLYNVAVYLLAGAAFAGVFRVFDNEARPDEWPAVIVPALLGTMANFAVNTGLVAAAIAISRGETVVTRWRENFQWLLPQYLSLGLSAAAAATAAQVMGVWGLAVFAAPVLGIRHAYVQGAKAAPQPMAPLRRAA